MLPDRKHHNAKRTESFGAGMVPWGTAGLHVTYCIDHFIDQFMANIWQTPQWAARNDESVALTRSAWLMPTTHLTEDTGNIDRRRCSFSNFCCRFFFPSNT